MVCRVFMNCPQASIKKHHYDLFSMIKEEAFSEFFLKKSYKATAVTI